MSFGRPEGGKAAGLAVALAAAMAAFAGAPRVARGADPKPPAGEKSPPATDFPVEAVSASDATPEPAAAPPPAKTGPRITVRAYDEEDGALLADPVEAAMGEALASDGRVAYKPFVEILIPPDEAARALGQADLALMDSEKAFGEMDLEKAKQLLKEAIQAYQRYLPQLAARGDGVANLRDAWIRLAKTRFFDGDSNGARDALRYAFVLDANVGFSPKFFPPTMKKTVVESKLLFETLGAGKLVIDSDPPGATAYLNGVKLPKPTPCDPIDAPPGPNFISYERRGYAPHTAIFENNGGGEQATALQALSRYPNNPLAPLQRARGQLDKTDTPPHLKEAAEKLRTDLLLLVRFSKSAEDVTMTAYLYDARPDRILKRASTTVPEARAPQAAKVLAQEVLEGVRLDGVYVPPPPVKKPGWWARFSGKAKGDLERFYRWKGFWYVVGGVAGAVVLSTVVGATVSADQQARRAHALILFGGN